jgi:hypothetical protein
METIILSYEGYLTEEKLIQLFKDLEKQINNIKVKINARISEEFKRFKGDIIVNDYYFIEFDGYQHYTKSSIFNRDSIKNAIWELQYKKVIRIPYFVQLTDETFNYYFKDLIKSLKLKIKIESDYPHGFIDKKAILPADFCSVGERRFLYEIYYLPEKVWIDIYDSLFNKIIEKEEAAEVISLNMREFDQTKEIINDWKSELPEAFKIIMDTIFEIKTGISPSEKKKRRKKKNKQETCN